MTSKIHTYNFKKFTFLIILLVINLIILLFNNHKFFKTYTYQINILSSKKDINNFNNYGFTILNHLRKQLGKNYEFKNYKITGPNLTSISFGQEKFKNKKKTDFIKSKNFIYFNIETNRSENISKIKKIILDEYPLVLNYVNNIDIFNITNEISNDLILICNKDIVAFNLGTSLCKRLGEKSNKLSSIFVDEINYLEVNDLEYLKKNKIIRQKLTKLINEIELIIEENNFSTLIGNLYYSNLLKKLDLAKKYKFDVSNLDKKKNLKLKIKFHEDEIKIKNNFSKYLIYINIIMMILILIISYLRLIFQKK